MLREHQLKLSNLSEELHDYEEYVESLTHEAKTPLALFTMILDNCTEEIPSDFHIKLDYIRSPFQEDISQILYYARMKNY